MFDVCSLATQLICDGQSFASMRLLYVKSVAKTEDDITRFVRGYSLYEARPYEDSDPVLIIDAEGIVRAGNSRYTVHPTSKNDVATLIGGMSNEERNVFERVMGKWGFKGKPLNTFLSSKLYTPLHRLKDVEYFTTVEGRRKWCVLIENILDFGGVGKDPRLMLVNKTHLLRGYRQKYNAHAIVATNPSTGKTAYYDKVGLRYDKVTAHSLIGYSRGREEVYHGAIHNQTRTLSIEQIESQVAQTFLGFLLTFMESGASNLTVGGVDMRVSGVCPIVLTANPTGYDTEKIATFRALIDHLTSNHLALGRRFGIIVYGNDYARVSDSGFDDDEWLMCFEIWCAVEDYVWRSVEKVYGSVEVVKWLNRPVEGYEEKVLAVTEKVMDSAVNDFVKTHAQSGFRHLRGGALACAVVDMVPDLLAFDGDCDVIVSPLLMRADGYLDQLVNVNLESFANMASTMETAEQIKGYLLSTLPQCLREVIHSVAEFKRRNVGFKGEVRLRELHVSGRESEEDVHVLEDKVKASKWLFYAYQLKTYFGFTFKLCEEGLVIVIE